MKWPHAESVWRARAALGLGFVGHLARRLRALHRCIRSGATANNDRLRMRKAKLIVMWGVNSAVSSNGSPTYHYLQAKKAGAKFIFIDPLYNDTAMALADEWIPIRPGTDTTMLLGMAYHMIENDLHDQAFLDKYCVGFDTDHLPEGVDPKENFKDYVLGTYDGQPKDPRVGLQVLRRAAGEDPRPGPGTGDYPPGSDRDGGRACAHQQRRVPAAGHADRGLDDGQYRLCRSRLRPQHAQQCRKPGIIAGISRRERCAGRLQSSCRWLDPHQPG